MRRVLGWMMVLLLWTGSLGRAQEPSATRVIQPGRRIGPVHVGMTVDALIDRLGLPSWAERNESLDIMDVGYDAQALIVALTQDGRVFFVTTYSATYADAHGLKVGSAAADIAPHYGAPSTRVVNGPITVWMYRARGLAFMVQEDQIVSIGVFRPIAGTETSI